MFEMLVPVAVVIAICSLAGAKKPIALGVAIVAAGFVLFWAAALTNGFQGYVPPAERLAKERAAYAASHPMPGFEGHYKNPDCPWFWLQIDNTCAKPPGWKPPS